MILFLSVVIIIIIIIIFNCSTTEIKESYADNRIRKEYDYDYFMHLGDVNTNLGRTNMLYHNNIKNDLSFNTFTGKYGCKLNNNKSIVNTCLHETPAAKKKDHDRMSYKYCTSDEINKDGHWCNKLYKDYDAHKWSTAPAGGRFIDEHAAVYNSSTKNWGCRAYSVGGTPTCQQDLTDDLKTWNNRAAYSLSIGSEYNGEKYKAPVISCKEENYEDVQHYCHNYKMFNDTNPDDSMKELYNNGSKGTIIGKPIYMPGGPVKDLKTGLTYNSSNEKHCIDYEPSTKDVDLDNICLTNPVCIGYNKIVKNSKKTKYKLNKECGKYLHGGTCFFKDETKFITNGKNLKTAKKATEVCDADSSCVGILGGKYKGEYKYFATTKGVDHYKDLDNSAGGDAFRYWEKKDSTDDKNKACYYSNMESILNTPDGVNSTSYLKNKKNNDVLSTLRPYYDVNSHTICGGVKLDVPSTLFKSNGPFAGDSWCARGTGDTFYDHTMASLWCSSNPECSSYYQSTYNNYCFYGDRNYYLYDKNYDCITKSRDLLHKGETYGSERLGPHGQSYRGSQNKTHNNKTCLKWSEIADPGRKKKHNMFPGNSCRSLAAEDDAPFCYYSGNSWERCKPKFNIRSNTVMPKSWGGVIKGFIVIELFDDPTALPYEFRYLGCKDGPAPVRKESWRKLAMWKKASWDDAIAVTYNIADKSIKLDNIAHCGGDSNLFLEWTGADLDEFTLANGAMHAMWGRGKNKCIIGKNGEISWEYEGKTWYLSSFNKYAIWTKVKPKKEIVKFTQQYPTYFDNGEHRYNQPASGY